MTTNVIQRITPELFRTRRAAKAWAAMLAAIEKLEHTLSQDRAATVDAIRLGLTARFAASLGRYDVAQELAGRYEDALEQAHRAAAEAQERRHNRRLRRLTAAAAVESPLPKRPRGRPRKAGPVAPSEKVA